VVILGDKLSKNSKITVGAETILKIQQIKADICFVGVNAIDIEGGLTDNDWDVVQVKRAMIKSSKKVIALSISEKVNTFEPLKICEAEDIDILVTELSPESDKLEPYSTKGIQIF
jgi:DeoR/GlpR family transcriptional regulator of sugar metabolism